jgi:hypothetical protein
MASTAMLPAAAVDALPELAEYAEERADTDMYTVTLRKNVQSKFGINLKTVTEARQKVSITPCRTLADGLLHCCC